MMANYMERMKAKSKDSKSVLQTLQEMEENGVGEEHKTEFLEKNERVKIKETENVNKEKELKGAESIENDEKVSYGREDELAEKRKNETNENLTQKQDTKKNVPEQIEKEAQRIKQDDYPEAKTVEKEADLKSEGNTTTVINMPTELIGEAEGINAIILDRDTALQNLQKRIFVKPDYTSSTSINLVTEYYVFLSTRAAQLKLTTNMYFHILLNEDRFYREITGDHEPIFEQVMYKYKGSRSHKNISFAEEDRKYFIEESARLGIKYTVFAHYLIEKEMDREKWNGKRKIGEIILREE